VNVGFDFLRTSTDSLAKAKEPSIITLYHRTTKDIARRITADGFRDSEGYYGTENLHHGVWLSDRALDADEGAVGNAVLRVELTKDEPEIAQFEWIEDGKQYREWLIPASLINECGTTVIDGVEACHFP
jgi:hypothetical protein